MGKPLPKRIPSDDCAVTIDNEVYHPHEGEYVEMYAGITIAELKTLEGFTRISVEVDAIQGEEEEQQKLLGLLNQHFDEICKNLAGRVVAWNWTDDRGQPLPQPDGKAETMERLRAEEILWLMKATQGETPAQR